MNSAGRAIFWGGLWCGILDILSAMVAWGIARGVPPIRIGNSVAAGLLGPAAAQGGVPVAMLGFACHFFIAFTAAAVYYAVSRKLTMLVEHPIICGLAYGEVVFLVMNMVVIPLSAIHRSPFAWTSLSPWPILVTGPIGHLFFVGLPIALATKKYGSPQSTHFSVSRYEVK